MNNKATMSKENVQSVADVLGITYEDAKNSAILYGEITDWYVHRVIDGEVVQISEVIKCIETRKTMSALAKIWTAYKLAEALGEMMPVILSVPTARDAVRTMSFKTVFEADA